MSLKTTRSDCEAELDDAFLAAVWQVLVDNSPEIDKFILAYRDKPNIGYHNWAGVIQEIAAAVAKVPYCSD